MRLKAYLLVFDGLADWEPAPALCEINKSGKYDVVTVAFSGRPVTTMGGCKIIPDVTLDTITPNEEIQELYGMFKQGGSHELQNNKGAPRDMHGLIRSRFCPFPLRPVHCG